MKNKFIITILVMVLLLPISVSAVEEAESIMPVNSQEEVREEFTQTLDEDNYEENSGEDSENIKAITPESFAPYKKPFGKRKLIKMFLKAMAGVGISCLLIYLLLTIYNNLRYGSVQKTKTPDGETTLDAPNDIDSAIKIFLEKTKWS